MRSSAVARAVQQAVGNVQVIPEYIPMIGGLDEITAPLSRKPGKLRRAQNFEAAQLGGYSRISGYERFDGRPKPSAAQYAILAATITGSPSVGQTLTGATSGATGVIIALPASNDQFVLTKVTGTYQAGENLNVGGPTIATATSSQVPDSASTPLLHATYRNLAADEYRDDIAAVPGSGEIRGGFTYNDVTYVFRNNAGGTAAALYKSTASGWSLVSFEHEVTYSSGSGSVDDGDTLTQGGVTATVRRVLVRTGSLSGGTAAGTLVISAPSGGNFAAGAATTTGGGTLTLGGVQTAITLLPSGRFETVQENFGGGANTKRVYGCDGVNRGFEFDGSYFVPIPTGMSPDTPLHVAAHKKQLFFSFLGSSQNSGPGTPFAWTPVLGATEIAMGDTITGYGKLPGSEQNAALPIFTRNRLSILYGSSSADFNLVPYRDELGAYPYTIQDIGYAVFLDDRGITDILTSQKFGNFSHGIISEEVRKFVNQRRTIATASCISRDKSQYRLFFSDGYGLFITSRGRKLVGIMPVVFDNIVRCAWSSEMNDGSEVMFFGSDDGFLYQMDRGTSFDGDPINYYFELAYNFSRSPRTIKVYRDTMLEVEGDGYAEFSFGYSLGYGTSDLEQPASENVVTSFSPVFWDAFVWDQFVWDGQTLLPSIVDMGGEAENVSLGVSGSSDFYAPFTITGVVLQFTPRRRMR